jgi:hypothetical protein
MRKKINEIKEKFFLKKNNKVENIPTSNQGAGPKSNNNEE